MGSLLKASITVYIGKCTGKYAPISPPLFNLEIKGSNTILLRIKETRFLNSQLLTLNFSIFYLQRKVMKNETTAFIAVPILREIRI
jgi:hypothetical protein